MQLLPRGAVPILPAVPIRRVVPPGVPLKVPPCCERNGETRTRV